MAVSGSNDFEQTEETIIRDALILIGGLEDDETPSDAQKSYARRALNRLGKAWSARGLKAWCWNEVSLTCVASQSSYTIGPSGDLVSERPARVANIRKSISGTETPIRQYSRSEYMNQPSKSSTGEPVAVYYDPQLTNGVMYVWPTPDAAHVINFSARQYIEDFDNSSNTPYYPVEWHDAIIYNLAYRLAPKYEIKGEALMLLKAQADEFLADAEAGDIEEGPLYIAPDLCG